MLRQLRMRVLDLASARPEQMMVPQHRCVERDFCSDGKVSWYLIQVILPRELP